MSGDHSHFMRIAMRLARRNVGQTWPNPSVGAVVVRDGRIVGEGVTAKGGRPHAETEALQAPAGQASLYVTLEPCSHHGKTPPCVDAIIKAGIARVVVACRDPDPRVNGKGIALLKQAGIEVIEGVCEQEAKEINRGFFSIVSKKRPFISLKIATSLDGKITFPPPFKKGEWITGENARAHAHLLRSRYDAIATGIGTVIADDPQLTCRLPGLEHASPVRIVFDRNLRLPLESKLVQTAKDVPLWVITGKEKTSKALEKAGVNIFPVGTDDMLEAAVMLLAEQGITRLLIEGGAKLTTAFLQSGLVDRMYWFRAPILIGNGGLAAADGAFPPVITGMNRWRILEHKNLQPDTLDILECSPA